MEFVIDSLQTDWESFLRFAPRLFYGFCLLLLFLIAARFAGRLTARTLQKSSRLRANHRFLQRMVTWSISAIGILLALSVMGFQGVAASMLATGGIAAIVLGFAFREIGENLLAGLFLTFSRPFELGDLVKTGDLTGEVRSIELRHVHIRTFDACDVFVPSAQIFRDPVYNYTRDGLRRPGFTIGVAYHDDPQQVIALLEKSASKVSGVLATPRPFVTISAFSAQHVEYEIFFWLDITKNERGLVQTSNDVKANCWRALNDADLTFSSNVTTGIEIYNVPELRVHVPAAQPDDSGDRP